MQELERQPPPSVTRRLAIVGDGRMGRALAAALRAAGVTVTGPLGRGASPADVDAVLLCVPDAEIAAAAEPVDGAIVIGHCSGITGLEALGDRVGFSLHPLMTVTFDGPPPLFAGAGAAVAGSSPAALAVAVELARLLGMTPIEIAAEDRAAYHAAASVASNFLVTVEAAAERLAATAGLARGELVPLVRATVDNWARLGPERALTGPVARGDELTVSRQRATIAERAPELAPLFDALVDATRAIGSPAPSRSSGSPAARMQTVRTVAEVRARLAQPRRDGATIGLVPTMGAFHEGHRSLMRRARAECDVVVVSLFVNPAQFNEARDLEVYPRDESRDAMLAEQLGVDLLFAPGAAEMYPDGFATTIRVSGVTETLEGSRRGRAHFDGVTTVVAKLLNIVGPDVAYFGRKDAQQAVAIRRMVADLDLPVAIEVCPTVRATDGLALSSRNAALSPGERERATSLSAALRAIEGAVASGTRDPEAAIAAGRAELAAAGVDPEYLTIVTAATLTPVARLEGEMLALVAARIGATRLIDSAPLHSENVQTPHQQPVATPLLGAPTA
jgi:pantoate--beta-alanine ligase